MAKHSTTRRCYKPNENTPDLWVAAALPGLEDLLWTEIGRRFKNQVSFIPHAKTSECHFLFKGHPRTLLSLRLCQSLYLRRGFRVIRPRTLLSPEHLATLVRDISSLMSIAPADTALSAARQNCDGAGLGGQILLIEGGCAAPSLCRR